MSATVLEQRDAGVGDAEIRARLLADLREIGPLTRVVEEWPVGGSRMDVAMIATDALTGWEIKSDRDSFARLDQQARNYSRICNFAWVVCGPKMAEKVAAKIPEWWGILVADGEPLTITPRRPSQHNPSICVQSTLWQLWCGELRDLARAYGLPPKVCNGAKPKLIGGLHETGKLAELRADTLRLLLARKDWKPWRERLASAAPKSERTEPEPTPVSPHLRNPDTPHQPGATEP